MIMATFLWGYASILSAMLCFHFVSCLILPIIFIAAMDCREDRRAVLDFFKRKLCVRPEVTYVAPVAAPLRRCCGPISFALIAQKCAPESREVGPHTIIQVENATTAVTSVSSVDEGEQVAAEPEGSAPTQAQSKPLSNGAVIVIAVVVWIIEAAFGVFVAWLFSIIEVLWDDIMEVIVDLVHSRYQVTSGAQAIFIGVWFSFVR